MLRASLAVVARSPSIFIPQCSIGSSILFQYSIHSTYSTIPSVIPIIFQYSIYSKIPVSISVNFVPNFYFENFFGKRFTRSVHLGLLISISLDNTSKASIPLTPRCDLLCHFFQVSDISLFP